MKTKTISIFLFIILAFSFNSKAQNIKQVENFKKIKKTIDTLAVLPSLVEVIVIDVNDKTFNDTTCETKISKSITKEINNLLTDKYTIISKENQTKYSDGVVSDIEKLLNELQNSKKRISNIEIGDSLLRLTDDKNRYYTICIFSGVYKTSQRIKHDKREILPKSIAVGLISLGTISLKPAISQYSIFKTIVFDRESKKVLFYSQAYGNEVHPKNTSMIKDFIMKCYKKIYYK